MYNQHSTRNAFVKNYLEHIKLSYVFLNKSSLISGSLLPRDCSVITDTRNQHNGTHAIYPFGVQTMPAYVYCEFDANGTAWTVCLFFTQLNGFDPLH